MFFMLLLIIRLVCLNVCLLLIVCNRNVREVRNRRVCNVSLILLIMAPVTLLWALMVWTVEFSLKVLLLRNRSDVAMTLLLDCRLMVRLTLL